MDWVQIDGREIPLLEAPQKSENPPRRILYVLFKHKKLVRNVFLLLIVPMTLLSAISSRCARPSSSFIRSIHAVAP